jgi:hypothetical protein
VLSILILMGFGSTMISLVLVVLIRAWAETKQHPVRRPTGADPVASHQMFDRS